MDSESKSSYIGSFLQPPNEMLPAAFASTEPKKLAALGGASPSMPNHQGRVKLCPLSGLFNRSMRNLLSKLLVVYLVQ